MTELKLNKWYINGNDLKISIASYFISIEREKDDLYILYSVDNKGHNILLSFESLEEAVSFTETNFTKHSDRNTIIDKYLSLKEEEQDEEIELNPEETKKVISDYYSKKYNEDLSCDYELFVKNMEPSIVFYLGEEKKRLDENDLVTVFRDYANKNNYDYKNFKYIGGTHRAGYFFDDDTAYFEGILISVNKKKNKVLEYSKN